MDKPTTALPFKGDKRREEICKVQLLADDG